MSKVGQCQDEVVFLSCQSIPEEHEEYINEDNKNYYQWSFFEKYLINNV